MNRGELRGSLSAMIKINHHVLRYVEIVETENDAVQALWSAVNWLEPGFFSLIRLGKFAHSGIDFLIYMRERKCSQNIISWLTDLTSVYFFNAANDDKLVVIKQQ